MLDYKECSIEDFERAMSQKNADVETLSDEYLYILYTKFMADAKQCFYAGTLYSRGLGYDSERQAKLYKSELQKRGINEN